MALFETGLTKLLTNDMAYLSQKEAVIARNVANADTPGYKAMTLAPATFAQLLGEAKGGKTMKVTDPRHITPGSMTGSNASAIKANSFETVPSGNSVDLEQQMMQSSKTVLDYQTMTAVYHKFMGMFRTAIGK